VSSVITAFRGGKGVVAAGLGGKDWVGVEMKREENAVGRRTGGGSSLDTGPPVIVMFGVACADTVPLFCSTTSSSSSLKWSG